MAGPQKLISLCMIVKNEERFLPGCLDSVAGIVDEIIIVDTGSTDSTAAIAESYGAVVIPFIWENDFAKARNAGVERASGEWILFLDADEQLDMTTRVQLLEFAREKELSALLLQIWNVVGEDEAQGATIHPVLRMFRSDAKHRFEGRIHEQIAASILREKPGARFHLTDVIIHHYGYRNQVIAEKNKLQRNMDLLELAIKEEPDNGFHRYNIGVEYLRTGQPALALEAFRKAKQVEGFRQLSYSHLVVKYESLSLQMLGRWAEALDIAVEGTLMFSDYPDIWHYKALCCAHNGQLQDAYKAAEKVLELGSSPPQYHTEDGMGTYRTAYLLGRICESLQDEQGVIRAYVTALRHKPGLMPPLFRLCRYFRAAGQAKRLPSLLSTRIVCPSEAAVLKLAAVMIASGCEAAAPEWVEWQAGLQKDSGLRQTLLERAQHMQQGDYTGLPFMGEEESWEQRATSVAESWRTRADELLERVLLDSKTKMEKKAVMAIRLLLPGSEGW